VGVCYIYTIMGKEEGIKKLLNNSSKFRRVLDTYIELRLLLKDFGYTEETIHKVDTPEYDLIKVRQKILDQIFDLTKQVHSFFPGDETWGVYLRDRFRKLDELYPLNDGSKERSDRGNEDLE